MSTQSSNQKHKSVVSLIEMKNKGEKISMLTAYDFSLAKLVNQTDLDIVLVGDSAANIMCGYSTTLPITLDNIIYHAQGVVRAINKAMVIVDLPFGSYQSGKSKALESAIKVMKQTRANGIKLEGGSEIKESIKQIVQAGIPVMGHLGLTPQSVNKFGGFGLRAKTDDEANKLLDDALQLYDAGCFAIVIEKIPSDLAKEVSEKIPIPIIGIGAGNHVDGQVLVLHDMLGITEDFSPKFLRKYADLSSDIKNAVKNYINDVKQENFPDESESY